MTIKLVSCTKFDRATALRDTKFGVNLERYFKDDPDDAILFHDNVKGLSERYNEALTGEAGENADVLVFIHDDVLIMDAFWKDKLEHYLGPGGRFDVVGVAGSSDFSINRLPATWHNSPKSSWSGAVQHPSTDKSDGASGSYVTSFGPTPKDVLAIDGLFIAVSMRSMRDSGVRFDERFTFDFYDLDFSLGCVKAGLRVGVIDIMCHHDSHGAGILSERYSKLQQEFMAKWKKSR